MDYTTLGRSGLRISPLTLGAMTFGQDWGWGASPEVSHDLIDTYLESGGNVIDTANAYTKGHSEKIIGDYFTTRPGLRDRTVIATKFFTGLHPGDPNSGGAGRKAIHNQVQASLRRLQTDYIDLYWMHAWDPFTPIDETLTALDDLVRAGTVRYIGFSDTPAWKVAQAQVLADLKGWSPLIALQIEYSLRQRTVEGDLIPMAQEMGLGVVPWSPLSGGVLTGKYRRGGEGDPDGRAAGAEKTLTDTDEDILTALDDIATAHAGSVAKITLAWVLQQPQVATTIIGAKRPDQLSANLASVDANLSSDELQRLEEVSSPTLPFPHDALGHMRNFAYAGTTINGHDSQLLDVVPKDDSERY